MVTLSSLTAAEETRIEENAPIFAARNLLAEATNVAWSTSGTIGVSNSTDPLYPVDALFDGSMETDTRPTGSAATVWYLKGQIPAGNSIDTFVLQLTKGSPSLDVDLQLADNDDFSTGLVTLDAATVTTTTGRIVAWGLPSGGEPRRAGAGFGVDIRFRVRFTFASATATIQVSELFLGAFRLFTRPWSASTDIEDAPEGVDFGEFMGVNRARSRYVRAQGFADQSRVLDFDEADDDFETLRSLRSESSRGAGSVWYRGTQTGRTHLMTFEGSNPMDAPIPSREFSRRVWSPSMVELPPFAASVSTVAFSTDNFSAGGDLVTFSGSADLEEAGAAVTVPDLSLDLNDAQEAAGGANSTLGTDIGSAFTISFWFYDTDSANSGLLGKTSASGWNDGYGFDVWGRNPTFWLGHWSTATTGSGRVISSVVPSSSTWYHVLGTYDGTDIELFINGTSEGTASADHTLHIDAAVDAANFTIGYLPGTASSVAIDDVAVWNRVLSASEISDLAGGDTASTISSGLVSHWTFDVDGTDSVGSNDMTIST